MLALLDELQIPYQCIEHEAVFTIEAMQKIEFPPETQVAKNLFLRDAKGKRHFLVVTRGEQAVELKQLEAKMGATKLSFASEQRLEKHLGVTKGAVSPLGLVNDEANAVEFYLDSKLWGCPLIGVHPNDNTATVLLSGDGLVRYATACGHSAKRISL